MGDCCIYDKFEQCFHDCKDCPQNKLNGDYEPDYDPYDKHDMED